ncbi:MAG: hypothetical protein HY770_04700, partial [Chitinivibrionia bacterium]|nr:hypothetical protein [Chitinivibrionia bacterium]
PGRALEAREYELFVGGEFLSAGSKPSNYFARWFLPGTLAVRSFSAEGGPDGVALEWDFFSNVEMAGIAVRRRESGTQTEITATGDRLLDPSVRRYLDAGAHPGKTYEYVLALLRADSSEVVSDAVEATMPVPPLALRQNCPNPFRKNTSIEFSLSRRSRVILGIYDIQGGLVAIVRDRIYEPGIWREEWDGTDRRGRPAGSGIYFYRFEAEGRILARKMLLLR